MTILLQDSHIRQTGQEHSEDISQPCKILWRTLLLCLSCVSRSCFMANRNNVTGDGAFFENVLDGVMHRARAWVVKRDSRPRAAGRGLWTADAGTTCCS